MPTHGRQVLSDTTSPPSSTMDGLTAQPRHMATTETDGGLLRKQGFLGFIRPRNSREIAIEESILAAFGLHKKEPSSKSLSSWDSPRGIDYSIALPPQSHTGVEHSTRPVSDPLMEVELLVDPYTYRRNISMTNPPVPPKRLPIVPPKMPLTQIAEESMGLGSSSVPRRKPLPLSFQYSVPQRKSLPISSVYSVPQRKPLPLSSVYSVPQRKPLPLPSVYSVPQRKPVPLSHRQVSLQKTNENNTESSHRVESYPIVSGDPVPRSETIASTHAQNKSDNSRRVTFHPEVDEMDRDRAENRGRKFAPRLSASEIAEEEDFNIVLTATRSRIARNSVSMSRVSLLRDSFASTLRELSPGSRLREHTLLSEHEIVSHHEEIERARAPPSSVASSSAPASSDTVLERSCFRKWWSGKFGWFCGSVLVIAFIFAPTLAALSGGGIIR